VPPKYAWHPQLRLLTDYAIYEEIVSHAGEIGGLGGGVDPATVRIADPMTRAQKLPSAQR